MNSRNQLEELSTEVFFFNLLGMLLQVPPNGNNLAWFQRLATEDVFDDVLFGAAQADILTGATAIRSWLNDQLLVNPDDSLEMLNSDYNRLLVGPGTPLAPPWESFYFNTQGLLFQQQTLQVREWFHRFDLKSARLHNEPDDHIGLEFAFLAHLAARAVAAIERDDEDACETIRQAQRDFFATHLNQWGPAWCKKMLASARTPFYQGVALLVQGSLKEFAVIHPMVTVSVE